jgi:hypothetical protein
VNKAITSNDDTKLIMLSQFKAVGMDGEQVIFIHILACLNSQMFYLVKEQQRTVVFRALLTDRKFEKCHISRLRKFANTGLQILRVSLVMKITRREL